MTPRRLFTSPNVSELEITPNDAGDVTGALLTTGRVRNLELERR